MKLGTKLIACLLSLTLLPNFIPISDALSLSASEFETVMIGETKVILNPTDAYGDQASIFAVMLAGHGQQKPDEAHCAHVAEHTVLRNPAKGNTPLGEWVVAVSTSNTSEWLLYNGWTGLDHTQFEITVPGEKTPEALERLLAGLFPEDIDKAAYDKEMRDRLQGELQYMTTNDIAAPFHSFNEHFYQGTPYCQSIFKVPVTQVSAEQVLEFMTREYSASRLVITIAGHFDRAATLAAIADAIKAITLEPRPISPQVELKLPPVTISETATIKHSLLMLGIGTEVKASTDTTFLKTAMQITLMRLAEHPPTGFTVSPSLLGSLPSSRTRGLLISYETSARKTVDQLTEQAESLILRAQQILQDLSISGPTAEETNPFLAELDLENNFPEGAPQTLITAFLRGRQEIPGIEDTYFPDMTADEFISSLQGALKDYESTCQYTVLVLMPAKTSLRPAAIAAGLALVIIIVLALLRGRNAKRKLV